MKHVPKALKGPARIHWWIYLKSSMHCSCLCIVKGLGSSVAKVVPVFIEFMTPAGAI